MAKQITISAPRPAPSFTPLFVAIDKFLPEEGIQAKIEYGVRNSAEERCAASSTTSLPPSGGGVSSSRMG